MCKKILIALVAAFIAASCTSPRHDGEAQEVAPVYALFGQAEVSVPDSILPEYEAFMKVVGADASAPEQWAASPVVKVFTPDVDSVFTSLKPLEAALGGILARAPAEGVELPRRRYAAVVWGRPESIMFCDSVMLIALNHYLGADYAGYTGMPVYRRASKTPERLPLDVAEALLGTQYPYEPSQDATVLSRLLYEGAQAALRMRVAACSAVDALGYTDQEYALLSDHESELWQMLVGRGLLYSTLPSDADRLVEAAPSTAILAQQAPGRAGRFIGYRIVEAYLSSHPGVSPVELLAPAFYRSESALRESGYTGR